MRAVCTVAILLVVAPVAHAQPAMQAATSPAGPPLDVVFSWPPDASVQRYNIYRRVAGAPAYPSTPLNATPITRLSDCAAIQAIIPIGSPDWIYLRDGLADGPAALFDPCAISTIAPGSAKETSLQFLARTRWRIAAVAGQGYRDATAVSGTAYQYQLRGVNAVGTETGVLFTDVALTAGTPSPIPPPAGLTAAAGDNRVLLRWGVQNAAAGFALLRATAAAGPYQRVNEAGFLTQITQDLNGTATPASNGFLDIRYWDPSGEPTTHLVQGTAIDGPANGVTYYYRVASLDLLGQAGPMSAPPASATPVDKTPPAAPSGVSVTAINSESRLEVRWNVVEHDIEGHREGAPLAGYRLFRYESQNAAPETGLAIGGLIPPPPASQTYATASDNDPVLRPPFGEKTFWYRVEAQDAAGNVSARSAAVSGHLADITPPAPPKDLAAEGFDDFIRLTWSANTEPDLDGYQVYRSLCHNGVCNPCDPRPRGVVVLAKGPEGEHAAARDEREKAEREKAEREKAAAAEGKPPGQPNKEEVCGGPYVLIGTVSRADAAAMGATVTFEDRTVPAGSPLCYSYWIKAFDRAQNRSGAWPVPDPLTERTVCQRLRDKTPPDPAIISGLFARDRAIRVEWVGPPVQDIRAYHVYRSGTEAGPYAWVGGMTVELPPKVPAVLTSPYTPPAVPTCDTIPLVTIESMSMGSFLDTKVSAKETYWYKVVGIDQSGNEASLAKAAAISTFTFTTATPPIPTVISVTATSAAPFGLMVRWSPSFDSVSQRGFAVFRSDRPDGLYRQIGTLLTAAEYQDNNVVRGATYWYRVLQMDRSGQISGLSTPASGSLQPGP